MGPISSKCLRQTYQNIFETPDSEISHDDGIEFDLCILSHIGVQIITIQSDESD